MAMLQATCDSQHTACWDKWVVNHAHRTADIHRVTPSRLWPITVPTRQWLIHVNRRRLLHHQFKSMPTWSVDYSFGHLSCWQHIIQVQLLLIELKEQEFNVHQNVCTLDGCVGEGFQDEEGSVPRLLNASRCGERRTVHKIRQFHWGFRMTGQRLGLDRQL